MAVSAYSRYDEEYWVDAEPDGTFAIQVPKGVYTLRIWVKSADGSFNEAGWYDGKGGVDRFQAFELSVDAENVVVDDVQLRHPSFYLLPGPTFEPTPPQPPGPVATGADLAPLQPDYAGQMNDSTYHRWDRWNIKMLGQRMPESAKKIEELPWVKDGIWGVKESGAVNALIQLFDVGYGDSLIGEPWVVEGSNYPALSALASLSRIDSEMFEKVVAHPAIVDGITGREAKVLATLGSILYPDKWGLEDHNLLDKLLDPDQAIIEERTIDLPLAGRTELTLLRTIPGDPLTMDFLERTVRRLEEFLGFPFPRQQVIVALVDHFGGGFHFATHIFVNRDFEYREGPDRNPELRFSLLAHEIAHHYTESGPQWILEGAATFMELVMYDELHLSTEDTEARLMEEQFGPCTLVENLSELEALPETGSTLTDEEFWDTFDCAYMGGALFFYELYHALSDAAFRQAFRRVYLHGLYTPDCGGDRKMSICHMKEAFHTYTPEEEWATVEAIFDRRYGPTDP